MTLQFDIRNDVDRVIKNAYVIRMCPILTHVTIVVPFSVKYRVIRSPSMRRRNIQLLNMDGLCHIEFYKRILVAPFIISVSKNSKLTYRG